MAKVIFPPRPKGAIPPSDLDHFEKTGLWVAQPKYNGSRNPIHIEPDGTVSVWSRHGSKHLSYSLPESMKNEILAIPNLKKGVEYWFDSELLNKTSATDTKNKIILFDILQNGKYLFLSPNQMGRLAMLDEICGHPTTLDPWRQMGYQISPNILMAPTFEHELLNHFNEFKCDEVEGLVLRKRNSVLDSFGQKEYEVSWLVRCRRQHKNYNF
jgi:ATP-dependent DNA ligase